MKKLYKLGCLVLGLLMALTLAIKAVQANTVTYGTPQQVGQGTARSYVTLGDRRQVSELGVILSESALTGLPSQMAEINLALPRQATRATPFTHIGLNWNPQGHPPAPIYGTPHFDLHFYTISEAARRRIVTTGADAARVYKTPDARLVPTGYVLAPNSAVPGEGSHWINPQAPEFQGAPHGFDHTFVYGFYNGNLDFLEPMISKTALEQHQTFDEAIARPARYSSTRAYPGRYSASYDTQAHEFRIALKAF
ncbi:MAG TPA: DUF5602 domain-containing protein [Crinalium sp.]|jgi:hypothetical protein